MDIAINHSSTQLSIPNNWNIDRTQFHYSDTRLKLMEDKAKRAQVESSTSIKAYLVQVNYYKPHCYTLTYSE